MTSKRKRIDIPTTSDERRITSNGERTAATLNDRAGGTSSNTGDTESHKDDDDIKAEIKRRREQLAKEEHDLRVSLCKARIERAVLTQARIIIDGRIRDLQKQV
jgi:hypothetical protein